jgi:uncharacterized short protein YbdD (DUF466 family)
LKKNDRYGKKTDVEVYIKEDFFRECRNLKIGPGRGYI